MPRWHMCTGSWSLFSSDGELDALGAQSRIIRADGRRGEMAHGVQRPAPGRAFSSRAIRGSRTRMKLLMHRAEILPVNMGVDLGSGQIGVTQHLLYCPKIGSPLEQVGGKAMTQGVRSDSL